MAFQRSSRLRFRVLQGVGAPEARVEWTALD
jgi:hypothetical protein